MCLGVSGRSTEYDFRCPWSMFLEFVGLPRSIDHIFELSVELHGVSNENIS